MLIHIAIMYNNSVYVQLMFDVRVFNPHSDTAQSISISACYTKHEKEKKRQYECRVCEIEHSSFTPLVFSTTGGMSKQATIFYKRLASLLATKRDTSYNKAINWIWCYISFSLLRSAIQCIRGARSSTHSPNVNVPADLVLSRAHPSIAG